MIKEPKVSDYDQKINATITDCRSTYGTMWKRHRTQSQHCHNSIKVEQLAQRFEADDLLFIFMRTVPVCKTIVRRLAGCCEYVQTHMSLFCHAMASIISKNSTNHKCIAAPRLNLTQSIFLLIKSRCQHTVLGNVIQMAGHKWYTC